MSELHKDIKDFLSFNKELHSNLEEIELPENDYIYMHNKGQLTMRKMGAYLRWLEIKDKHGDEEFNKEFEGTPYDSIHNLNKDDEIKKIYEENEEHRKAIQQERSKEVPNYYYLVYPETYSFN